MNKLVLLSLMTLLVGCTTAQQPAATQEPTADIAPEAAAAPTLEPPPLQMPQIEYRSDDDIGLLARVHFATHTTDFDRARAFYRMLGYTQGVNNFPLTNTHLVAQALGMFDICQYDLEDGEVISLPGAPNYTSIDLLQFKTPFNDASPYSHPNHLGMAYAAFSTSHFTEDLATLRSNGVELLSEPHGTNGNRFVFFRDPDGVLYKLEALPKEGASAGSGMHIYDMPYIAVNVRNLEASLEFYARFGYQPIGGPRTHTSSVEEARAYGFDAPFTKTTIHVAIDRGDGHRLKLSQWHKPFNPEPAYPPPINHIGINRIALVVPDVDRAVAALKRQQVPFLSEVAPCCSGTGEDTFGIVHAIDPDGVFLELVGGIAKRPMPPPPEGCPAPVIKTRTQTALPPTQSDAS